jgi:hypothetical protein
LANDLMCGACHTAWDLICGKVKSHTPLFIHIEHCRHGGCDERVWEYVSENGSLKEEVPVPEYVPGLPRTEMHRSNRPGPYRKEDGPRERTVRRPRKQPVGAGAPVPEDTGWSSDW